MIDQMAIIKNKKGSHRGRSAESIGSLLLRISANLMIKGLAMILNSAPVPNNAIKVRLKSFCVLNICIKILKNIIIRTASAKNERTKTSGVSDTVNPEIDWLRK